MPKEEKPKKRKQLYMLTPEFEKQRLELLNSINNNFKWINNNPKTVEKPLIKFEWDNVVLRTE